MVGRLKEKFLKDILTLLYKYCETDSLKINLVLQLEQKYSDDPNHDDTTADQDQEDNNDQVSFWDMEKF